MPLQASITGLHGAFPARRVKVANETATSKIVSTAMGRRFQLFSPSPKMKGKSTSPMITSTGPISSTGVSMDGGSSDSTGESHKKKKSGRGAVWMMVGSGGPEGPNGPK